MEKISFDDNLKQVIAEANKPKPRFFTLLPIFHATAFAASRWFATTTISDHAYCLLPTDIAAGIISGTAFNIIDILISKKEIKKANVKITYLSTELIDKGFYVKEDKIKEAIIIGETLTKNIGKNTSKDTTNDYHMLDMNGEIVVLREYRRIFEQKRRLLKKKSTTVELYALTNNDINSDDLPVKRVPQLILK